MKTLFEIEKSHFELLNEVAELDGELTEEMEQRLIINEKDLQGKSIAYLSVIRSNESFESQIDAEIKRLQVMKKRTSKTNEYLKSRLLDAVKLFGEFTSGLTTFGTRKSSSIEILDTKKIPAKFVTVKMINQYSKDEIKKAIKAGEKVNGAILVEKLNLKIK
jgi:hypothetical protein